MASSLFVLVVFFFAKPSTAVIDSFIAPEGSSIFCPGTDIILKCERNSMGEIKWILKTGVRSGLPIFFDNTTNNQWRRDDVNFSTVYYNRLGISLLVFETAYTDFVFTCNNEKTFNLTILNDTPLPRNVQAWKSNGSITVSWMEPDQNSEVVRYYLVDIGDGESPREVFGTQYIFNVSESNPDMVYVMAADVCGNTSLPVEADVINFFIPTTITTDTDEPSESPTQNIQTTCSYTGYIVGIIVALVVLLLIMMGIVITVIILWKKKSYSGAEQTPPKDEGKMKEK